MKWLGTDPGARDASSGVLCTCVCWWTGPGFRSGLRGASVKGRWGGRTGKHKSRPTTSGAGVWYTLRASVVRSSLWRGDGPKVKD